MVFYYRSATTFGSDLPKNPKDGATAPTDPQLIHSELTIRIRMDKEFADQLDRDSYLEYLMSCYMCDKIPDRISQMPYYATIMAFVERSLHNRARISILQRQWYDSQKTDLKNLHAFGSGYEIEGDEIDEDLAYLFQLLTPFAREFPSLKRIANIVSRLVGEEDDDLERQPPSIANHEEDGGEKYVRRRLESDDYHAARHRKLDSTEKAMIRS